MKIYSIFFPRENVEFLLLFLFALFSILDGTTVCEYETPVAARIASRRGFVVVDYEGRQAKFNFGNWENFLGGIIYAGVNPYEVVNFVIRNNCKLTLNADPYFVLPNLKSLGIVNVSELIIPKDGHIFGCPPPIVVMVNIGNINDINFPYVNGCNDSSTLKGLVLKNVSINVLSENFTAAFGHSLMYLKMENVRIEVAKTGSLKLENKNAVVKISNSVIGMAEADFINLNVSEVIFSENIIKDFNETDRILRLEADEVIFKGNKMKAVTNETMKIISPNAQITENSFNGIGENAGKRSEQAKSQ